MKSIEEKARLWDYYQDLVKYTGFGGITHLLAENKRLQKAINEASAQGSVGRINKSIDSGVAWNGGYLSCKDGDYLYTRPIPAQADDYTLECLRLAQGARDHYAQENSYLKAELAKIQQSNDQVLKLLLESRENFEKQFGFSADADWVYKDLADLFNFDLPAQQSPAVAVPESVVEAKEKLENFLHQNTNWHPREWAEIQGFIDGLVKSKSPRITEQDAKWIFQRALIYAKKPWEALDFEKWFDAEGRALLEKLNKPDSVRGEL